MAARLFHSTSPTPVGLLNGLTGNGSNSGQQSAVSQADKAAIKATQLNPNSAAAWANLIQARWSNARANSADINANTGQFTAAGNKELSTLGQDYQRYKSLVKQPDPNIAILAARLPLDDHPDDCDARATLAHATLTGLVMGTVAFLLGVMLRRRR